MRIAAVILAFAGCMQGEPDRAPAPASAAPAPTEFGPQPGDLVPRVSIRARAVTGGALVREPFDVKEVARIDLDVEWPRAVANGAPHEQRIDFFTPDGSLYRTVRVPFQDVTSVSGGLPIAGTDISRYALAGAWRASIRIDGNMTPIAEARFVLR